MGLGSWYRSQDVLVKAAVVSGIFAVLAAAVPAGIALAGSSSPGPQPPSSNANSSASRSAPSSPPVPPPTTKSPAPTEPLSFYNLTEGQKVGPQIQPLKVKGTVPTGDRAWVLVKSSGDYYVQGVLSPSLQSPNLWIISTVSFGMAGGPVNTPYVVYVVLADPHADSLIQADYKNTDLGNNGTPEMPGGAGAKVACSVTVFRTH